MALKRVININNTWPGTAAEAIAIQKELMDKVLIHDDFGDAKIIAGVDCSYDIKSNLSFAFIVLMKRGEWKVLESVSAKMPTKFPYVPGLLSFREIPVILKAFEKLKTVPDLFMVDGQGIAHPRRLGIAAHLGVLLDIPSIGVAKSKLTGHYAEPDLKKDSESVLKDRDVRIGTVLRSKDNVKPLFISPGHKVGQESAVKLVREALTKYRLPEPTRIADKLSKMKENKLL